MSRPYSEGYDEGERDYHDLTRDQKNDLGRRFRPYSVRSEVLQWMRDHRIAPITVPRDPRDRNDYLEGYEDGFLDSMGNDDDG